MLSVYINYPAKRISVHQNPTCKWIQPEDITHHRVIYIDSSNVESELNKLKNKELTFASTRGFNDVWIYINLKEAHFEEKLVEKIHEILGNFYKRIAHSKIDYHCLSQTNPSNSRAQNIIQSKEKSKSYSPSRKVTIPEKDKKIDAIVKTITTRIAEINSIYRSGPDFYFYRRVLAQRRKFSNIREFFSLDYNLELLYAVLVSWDMNSRRAKMKYFDDFKSNLKFCLPELEAIDNKSQKFKFANENEILILLKNAYLKLALMETSGRLVSNSKCLHFLFPSFCMPMDGKNTLQYIFNNTNESIEKYLDILRFQFEVM